jgi:3-oxoacyl-[acyl-carrier protein] reductase
MGDFLLELSKNRRAKQVLRAIHLPLPLPQVLRRAEGGWEEQPLRGDDIVLGAAEPGEPTPFLNPMLSRAGARCLEPPKDLSSKDKVSALVFDASGIRDVAGLKVLHDFFAPRVRRVRASGRVLVLGSPPSAASTSEQAAVQQALDGFVRSLAKEVGKRGVTVNRILFERAGEERLEGVLWFFLSARSAFVTGQSVRVGSRLKATGEPRFTKILSGKVAVVTGAARGIGAATAELLAAEGAHVVCLDRPQDEGPLREVALRVKGSALLADVSASNASETLVSHLTDKHGGVDIVVHNAGITRDKTLAKMSGEAWDQVMDVNLGAVVRINERLLSGAMRDGGRIVCLSSMAGIAGNVGQTNYTASKAGIIGYVGHLAEQVAARGIGVHAVAPGFIETRMTAAIPMAIREVGRRASALGQGGQPRDVAEVITFLCSDASFGMTGSVLRVCGGSFLGA